MHPYAVAKMVSSLGHLYGRRVFLNMVAGGFKNDLSALNDTTPHDKRYARLVEYTTIIQELLRSPAPVSYRGEFYVVDKLRMTPPLPEELMPEVFVSGSSEAGLAAATALGAVADQSIRSPLHVNRTIPRKRNPASGSESLPANQKNKRGVLPMLAFRRIAKGN